MIHLISAVLRYSVVVSTPDFESGNPGSNPGTANIIFFGCHMLHHHDDVEFVAIN